MTLLQDTNVYQPCRDLTGQIHRQVQATLHKLKGKYGKEHQWVQVHYSHLLPTGNTSPPARFYGLLKIHKANCPLQPIVSACGTSTYNLAKYLTTILKVYTEMDHLGKVLRYNNFPKWVIEQSGKNTHLAEPLIDLDTGNEVKKTSFISAPYFLGLSESFKQLFKYTHIRSASRDKTPSNPCSCTPKTKSILCSKRM